MRRPRINLRLSKTHAASSHGCGQQPGLSSLGFVPLRAENLIVQQHVISLKTNLEDVTQRLDDIQALEFSAGKENEGFALR